MSDGRLFGDGVPHSLNDVEMGTFYLVLQSPAQLGFSNVAFPLCYSLIHKKESSSSSQGFTS